MAKKKNTEGTAGVGTIDPALFNRRHPTYDELFNHWKFVEDTYNGGRAWFKNNVFKYTREGETGFADRLKRSYRFNHTRECVDLVTKYVFKTEISRKDDAPDAVKKFWKRATKGGEGIDTLMRQVDRYVSIFGQPYIAVDSTARGDEVVTKRDEKRARARTYAYVIRPQDALDMSFDDHGELNWFLAHELRRDDDDFYVKERDNLGHYRLWTRSESILYRVREASEAESGTVMSIKEVGAKPFHFRPSSDTAKKEKKYVVEEVQRVPHNLGRVPIIPVRDRESDSEYHAPALVDDIAYLDRAVANYLSNLDAIIQDQTFSILTIPMQSIGEGGDQREQVINLGTKSIFTYDGEGGKGPEFISPDPKQAGIIIAVITKIITEIYHSIGMAGERTKMDNAAGIDNSSGVAKAYDFDRLNTMLKSKADRLQSAENKIASLVMAWNSEPDFDEKLVVYANDFDTRGLYDEFDIANRLTLLDAPDELRRYQFVKLIDKLFPNLAAKLREKIEEQLAEEWPNDEVDVTSTKARLKDQSKPAVENKQGQSGTDEKDG